MLHGDQLPYTLPPFTYPAYRYTRHLEGFFKCCQTDKKNFDRKLFFKPWADHLHETLPSELKRLVPYGQIDNHLTWRDIVNALRKYDGGHDVRIEYLVKEKYEYQYLASVEDIPVIEIYHTNEISCDDQYFKATESITES